MHDYKWHKVSEMLPDKCGIYDVKSRIAMMKLWKSKHYTHIQ